MNWYHKEIRLGIGAGTLDIMEWIRDNGCPNLDCTLFKDARGNDVATVSMGDESMFEATLDAMKEGIYEWFEYEGMKRHCGCCGVFVFLIDNNYYWATR